MHDGLDLGIQAERRVHDARRLGEIVAAINLSGPDAVMDSPESQARYLAALLQTAERISAELGR